VTDDMTLDIFLPKNLVIKLAFFKRKILLVCVIIKYKMGFQEKRQMFLPKIGTKSRKL
jgi:hypothetical protein